MKYILAYDQGTTGTTAAIIDSKTLKFIGKINKEFPQIMPSPGYVEHNLNDIWNSLKETTIELFKKFSISADQIETIGITNQRETTCAFSKDGTPLENAIVWQDRRTSDLCLKIREQGHEKSIKEKTGLTVDPYFSSTKISWLLNNSKTIKASYEANDLCFGTIDTFLLYKLTGNVSFKTEGSNASRTMLYNLKDGAWDNELLDIFNINKSLLPEVCDSFSHFGETLGLDFLPDGISITGILGDQQAALFGQAGINKNDIKCTYGTGAFILLNTGNDLLYSLNGLLTTVAYRENGKNIYALEGSCYMAGAAVQWLRDNLEIIKDASEIEILAKKVTSNDDMKNLVFLPFFTGIGSPHWKPEAKAALIGMSRDTNKNHIAKACLEGIALSINDLVESMEEDTKVKLMSLKVDGGACSNDLLMIIQATLGKLEVIRPKVIETTAYGAAMVAAIGKKIVSKEDIQKLWAKDTSFTVDKNQSKYYAEKKDQWKKLIKKLY